MCFRHQEKGGECMYANKALQEGAEQFARRTIGGSNQYASSRSSYSMNVPVYSTYD